MSFLPYGLICIIKMAVAKDPRYVGMFKKTPIHLRVNMSLTLTQPTVYHSQKQLIHFATMLIQYI